MQITHLTMTMTMIYYRATLCVSAVFAVARCLSVCPSRWCIVSTWLKDIVTLLCRSGSPIILVFLTPNAGT